MSTSVISALFEVAGDEASQDRNGKQQQTRIFKIQTNTRLPPVQSAQLLLDLIFRMRPDLKPFASHPNNKLSYVEEPRLHRESRWVWELQVSYSTQVDLADLEAAERGEIKRNPLTEPAKVTITGTKETKIITKDNYGKPLANEAGDRFPDVEDVEPGLEISVQKNVAQIRTEWLRDYPNAINTDEIKFLGIAFPKLTLLFSDPLVGDRQIEENVKFYPFGFKLIYKRGGWKKKLLNEGLRERRPVYKHYDYTTPIDVLISSKIVRITDTQGEPIDEPVFLDWRGRAYRVGVDPKKLNYTDLDYRQPLRAELKPEEIITLEFDVKRELPFQKLPYQ